MAVMLEVTSAKAGCPDIAKAAAITAAPATVLLNMMNSLSVLAGDASGLCTTIEAYSGHCSDGSEDENKREDCPFAGGEDEGDTRQHCSSGRFSANRFGRNGLRTCIEELDYRLGLAAKDPNLRTDSSE